MDANKFDTISWPKGFDKQQLFSLEFIEKKQNILCLGAVGTGKTYLATALGVKACTKGKQVSFYQPIDLVTVLVEKHRTGHLGKTLEQLL